MSAAAPERMGELSDMSAALRRERARLRERGCGDVLFVASLLRDCPPAVMDMPLIDVIAMARSKRTMNGWSTRLGDRALVDQVNLLGTVRDSTPVARAWAIRNGFVGKGAKAYRDELYDIADQVSMIGARPFDDPRGAVLVRTVVDDHRGGVRVRWEREGERTVSVTMSPDAWLTLTDDIRTAVARGAGS